MRRLIREPLLHSLALGALLFALYGWLHREGFNPRNEIVVSKGQVSNLRSQFERLWQRDPTQQELQGLIDNWVREEIFYREGLAMGLDRDDPIVRRRGLPRKTRRASPCCIPGHRAFGPIYLQRHARASASMS
jgi:hypothetical protein